MPWQPWGTWGLCVTLMLGAGCSGGGEGAADRPARVRVSGTVLYNKQPVEGATVVFVPQGHVYGATGLTDAEGKFQLRTFEANDGAVPGEYKVMVSKVSVSSPGGGQSDDDAGGEAQEKLLLPEKYRSANTSGLTATVSDAGENNFTFELEGAIKGSSASGARTVPSSE